MPSALANPKSAAVIEVQSAGHHPFYLRLVSESLTEAGYDLQFGLSGDLDVLKRLRSEAGYWFNHLPNRVVAKERRPRRLAMTRELGRWLAEWKPELVFFNSFDLVASTWCRMAALGWRPPKVLKAKIAGFYLRPRFLEPEASGFQNRWKRIGFSNLVNEGWFRQLLILDETMLARRCDPAWQRVFSWVPDPWDGDFSIRQAAARATWKLPAKRRILLHFGTGSPRKGLPWIVEAMESLPPEERPYLVCGGQLDLEETLRLRLQQLEIVGSARVFDRYFSEQERLYVFRAADAVALAYRAHYGSSGILVNAAAAGRPVIATDSGLVGERVRQHGLGVTVPEGDVPALAKVLRRLAIDEEPLASEHALRDFADEHSVSAFKASFKQALASSDHDAAR